MIPMMVAYRIALFLLALAEWPQTAAAELPAGSPSLDSISLERARSTGDVELRLLVKQHAALRRTTGWLLDELDRSGDPAALRGASLSSHRALSCPSWARTRTLLIQSQTCCQLHQGAENLFPLTRSR